MKRRFGGGVAVFEEEEEEDEEERAAAMLVSHGGMVRRVRGTCLEDEVDDLKASTVLALEVPTGEVATAEDCTGERRCCPTLEEDEEDEEGPGTCRPDAEPRSSSGRNALRGMILMEVAVALRSFFVDAASALSGDGSGTTRWIYSMIWPAVDELALVGYLLEGFC